MAGAVRPPSSIGPYVVRRELGRGGMGAVYEAAAPDGRAVAVKVLLGANERLLQRFDRERRLLAQLGSDKGFVPLLDAGSSPAGPYLVLEFVGGGTLRERQFHGALDLNDVLDLGKDLARALSHAHDLGIVHRDLKPENVLFTKDGRPLIADLGLAKHFSDEAQGISKSISITGHGEFAGTVGYAAPEQIAGSKDAGPAVDVFALGAILYECLAGTHPFRGATPSEVFARIASADPEPLARARPGCPRGLARVIARALARDPAHRYADGRALLRALEQPGLLDPSRGHGFLVGFVSVLVLGGAIGAFLLRGGPTPPPETRPQPSAPPTAPRTEDPGALLAEARKVLATDPGRARALAEKALALAPRDARAWVVRGRARGHQHDFAGALDDAKHAIDLAPRLAEAYVLRGTVKRFTGDGAGCLVDLDYAIELDPNEATAWQNRASLHFEEGRLADALASSDRACELAPSEGDVFATRGGIKAQRGDLEGALSDLTRAIELGARSTKPRFLRAQIHAARGRLPEALADLDRALELEDFDPAHRLRADILWKLDRKDDALVEIEGILARHPDDAQILAYRAVWRVDANQLDAALDDVARALAVDPRNRMAHLARCEAYRRKNDDAKALEALEAVLPLAATNDERRLIQVQVDELKLKLKKP